MVLALLCSGIGRRIFHIKKTVVEQKGLFPAVLSRINCMRFYCSIVWYTALMFAVFYFDLVGSGKEGSLIRFGIAPLVCMASFFFVTRSCPSCGVRLSWDGDEDDTTINVKYDKYSDSVTAKQGYTEHYHCPRCGRKVRIRGEKTVGQINHFHRTAAVSIGKLPLLHSYNL